MDMQLTNELIESKGFKRINNSMWRLDNITLQNGYKVEGNTIAERILSSEKAYKVCIDGKYNCMITNTNELAQITLINSAKKYANSLLKDEN